MAEVKRSLMRERQAGRHARVGFVELFFDLVFVFAVTQIAHTLVDHLDFTGALQAGMMLMAVWWAWVYTAWATNWLDPERAPVRLLLFALMAVALVMSASLPEAFGDKGLVFGVAFALFQLGRSLFVLWAVRSEKVLYQNFIRISVWMGASASLWVAGGLADGGLRTALWAGALAIEYAGPAAAFWLPFLGRSHTEDWNVEGAHMSERTGLFVIIALGESILVLGATFAKLDWTPPVMAALAAAFLGSIAMWWIYFAGAAEAASKVIEKSKDPGRIARRAYTYAPLILVAGIIVTAVGDELSLAHPDGHMDLKTAVVLLGGPALFLAGSLFFKLAIFELWSPSRLTGLALLAALAPFALALTPLGLACAATGVLLFVAAWETIHLAQMHLKVEEA